MRSTFRRSIAFAFAAIAYASGLARAVTDYVGTFLREAIATFARPSLQTLARPVELVQACAYALRQAKRERPEVTLGSWRMCPST